MTDHRYTELVALLRSGVNEGADLPAALNDAANAIEVLAHREESLRSHVTMLVGQIQTARREIAGAVAKFVDIPVGQADIWFGPEAQAYFAEGRFIHTIKQLYGDNPGLGLAEAKRFVDALRDGFSGNRETA